MLLYPCVLTCVCVHVCLSSVRGIEHILRSKERYADTKKAHLCDTHAHTQRHTRMYAQPNLYTRAKKHSGVHILIHITLRAV